MNWDDFCLKEELKNYQKMQNFVDKLFLDPALCKRHIKDFFNPAIKKHYYNLYKEKNLFERIDENQQEINALFLKEKIETLNPFERPNPGKEFEDLERRLFVAVESIRLQQDQDLDQDQPPLDENIMLLELVKLWNIYEEWIKQGEKPLHLCEPITIAISQEPGLLEPKNIKWIHRQSLESIWPVVFNEWRKDNAEKLAARTILKKNAESDILANANNSEGRLAQAIRELLPDAYQAIKIPSNNELEACGEQDGMFALDAALANFIENQKSAIARDTANKFREKWRVDFTKAQVPGATPIWQRWTDSLRIPRVLARFLWTLKVRPELDRENNRYDSAGLIAPTVTSLVAIARRGVQMNLFEPNKGQVKNHRGQVIAELNFGPTIDGQIIGLPKIAALGTLATQRLLRWLIWEGYEKRFIRNESDYSKISIHGGWEALAAKLGLKGRKAAESFRDAANALASLSINTPLGYGQIFAFYYSRGGGVGNQARLDMHLLGPLRPGYVNEELAAHKIAINKKIVPVPMPHLLPPMVGREQDWATQAQLQLLVLREMRLRAEELEPEGVLIEPQRWIELADEASMPKRLVNDVLEAWQKGNSESPAFLIQPKQGGFDLASDYERERKSIVSAAKRTELGRKAGRKGAAAKAKGKYSKSK